MLILAGRHVIHTVKWVNEFSKRGHEVHLVTLHRGGLDPLNETVRTHFLPYPPPFGYYLNVPHLRRLLRQIEPDVVNAHYASGYGTLARLSRCRPLVLSVWGSDVFEFPYRSWISRRIIQKNLAWADCIASTSHAMSKQVDLLLPTRRPVEVVPFGVDCSRFVPGPPRGGSELRIGTVKTLSEPYGIDTLIRAFALVVQKGLRAKLVIAGSGPQAESLKALAHSLGIADTVEFLGRVPNADVPNVLRSLDVFVALSNRESFGVAVLEASACGLPVVVSNVGGLPEVVRDGITGFVVPPNDPQAAADRILQLALDDTLRSTLGLNGRKFVVEHYEWNVCSERMESVLRQTVDFGKQACEGVLSES